MTGDAAAEGSPADGCTPVSRLVSVRRSNEMGRYAVAASAVSAGQVLFEEQAFAVGPKPHSAIVCLGCCRPLANGVKCALCGWPLCRSDCASAHLHRRECDLFRAAGARFYGTAADGDACMQLDCITPLRMLLERDRDPERWRREIEPMESHNEARRLRADTWQADQVNIVGYLHGPCGLRDRYPAELIQRCCGLLEVNSFEGRTEEGFMMRCVFPCTAIMAHECVPNTMHTIHPGKMFRIEVRATVDVPAGEMLVASYTYTSCGTMDRQEHLRSGKFFVCRCARCVDPSELGTHFSSVTCRKCDGGLIMPTEPLGLDPSSDWNCNKCEFVTRGTAMQEALAVLRTEMDAIEEMPFDQPRLARSELFLLKYGQLLSSNHYMLTIVRHSLISMYGRMPGYMMHELCDEQIDRKMDMCERVLSVLDVVHPGLSRARALMLYELHAPYIIAARRQYDAGRLSEAELRERLARAAEMLLVCSTVLGWEAPSSAVATVAQLARNRREELIQDLHGQNGQI